VPSTSTVQTVSIFFRKVPGRFREGSGKVPGRFQEGSRKVPRQFIGGYMVRNLPGTFLKKVAMV